MSDEVIALAAPVTTQKLSDVRHIRSGSLMYRLRCFKATQPMTKPWTEAQIIAADVVEFPRWVSIVFNKKPLELRRKAVWLKDLPAEITSDVRPGRNDIEVAIVHHPTIAPQESFALVAEEIEIMNLAKLKEAVTTIPAAETLKRLQRQLTSDDEDIEIVSDDLIIGLVDPFDSKAVKTPAKTKTCLHYECFDLDNFLQTRILTQPEKFKCPICQADSRPKNLQIDGWLASVIEQITKDGKLDEAKAVSVHKDGTWKIKEDTKKKDNHSSNINVGNTFSTPQHIAAKMSESAASDLAKAPIPVRRNAEVIEID